jgi:hypothetical protein
LQRKGTLPSIRWCILLLMMTNSLLRSVSTSTSAFDWR